MLVFCSGWLTFVSHAWRELAQNMKQNRQTLASSILLFACSITPLSAPHLKAAAKAALPTAGAPKEMQRTSAVGHWTPAQAATSVAIAPPMQYPTQMTRRGAVSPALHCKQADLADLQSNRSMKSIVHIDNCDLKKCSQQSCWKPFVHKQKSC